MRFARRPWGYWALLINRKYFKVKLLYFKKNGQLSLQKHKYRTELWLFLKGSGSLYYGGSISEGMYAIIPKNEWHQYKAKRPTIVLEIQYGLSCNEQDIERINV